VLITGETGVGKELIARCIHKISGVKGNLVIVNVAGLDDNVFSDTLFGHAKGAFTGADQFRRGLVEQAAGGMLFLDEIGDLSAPSQVKLLRLLQEGEYLPLGQDEPKHTDTYIITATNEDLWKLQREGKFRKDLNFRLRTHHIHIPPLRERPDDILLLVDRFLEEASVAMKKKKTDTAQGTVHPAENLLFSRKHQGTAGNGL
jgi:transcriptional regulator with GAF, ATPase, and Fis domain